MPTKPALQGFIEDFVGGSFTVAVSTVTVGATFTKIASNNYERMALTIINTGNQNVTILPSISVTTTMGVILAANGGAISLDAQEDLAAVGFEWDGIVSALTSTMTVIETIRYNASPEQVAAGLTA